ncbi:NAD-dependent epimerase/dehydratase family protein [Protaetiibacter larvae]|uniref:NAD(P)-dependent oxidoreductase n=1 Tax=Protaetiibacter larvae TaxID=2592654 RepID=A0A5C1Y820_9MICO|nr:NAD(P)-dependent oxidoreductase [Protaetiibacter larvae]QEO09508.1 NAD(P)-dependent oxidoreductase [Protaetiibacter larvae]
MRIAVTGASGFIGGAVASALAREHHEVVGFGRTPHGWAHPHAGYRVWDIAAGPLRGDRDFEAVVHCAALADDAAPLTQAMRVNRTGTRHVVASFPGARIVHLSTASVYDAFTPTVLAREDAAPVNRFLSSYAESKTFAEFEVSGADAVILRPHAVYGPGDTTLLPRVLEAVRGGRLVLPEGARVLHSLTRIDHLVDAVRLALRAPAGVYNIADAEPVLLAELLKEFLRRRGVAARIRSLPYPVAFGLAGAAERLARIRGGRARLTRYAVSQLGLERTLELTAARERLGYRPGPTSLHGAERW